MRKQFGLILLIFALAGCGNQSYIGDNQRNKSAVSNVGTNGQLISIQSDNVKAAGYDEASMVMTVQFENGALYEYYSVPAELWTSFVLELQSLELYFSTKWLVVRLIKDLEMHCFFKLA